MQKLFFNFSYFMERIYIFQIYFKNFFYITFLASTNE